MFLPVPLYLLLTHWIGDFLLQSDWMALNKSKNTWEGSRALFFHVLTYSSCFIWLGLEFTLLTFVMHWPVDFVTSRITRRLFPFVPAWPDDPPFIDWYNKDGEDGRSNHWFFVVIGLDQLIHYLCLSFTLYLTQ